MAKRMWVDLSGFNAYLGMQRNPADGVERFVLLDMEGRANPELLKHMGFEEGSSGALQYQQGVYFLAKKDVKLDTKALASAFGVRRCPVVQVESEEISQVFAKKLEEKAGLNIAGVVKQARLIGLNRAHQPVYEGVFGRFIRLSEHRAITEEQRAAGALGRPAFLRAQTPEELRACADGLVERVRAGEKLDWNDLVRFAQDVYAGTREVDDMAVRHVQEAVEAAGFRALAGAGATPDRAAFDFATDLYYGLPVQRMRTAESLALQQFSTALPLGVVAQRLMVGTDDVAGARVLEPTAGNAGLVNVLPPSVKVFAMELDANRVGALNDLPNVEAVQGDAISSDFRTSFDDAAGGFDYLITNPPFGQLEGGARSFDKLPNVRRQDHYIALRGLAARRDQGRAVIIYGADSARSTGKIDGGTKHFLNYVYDHYDVLGHAEIDGRMYSRQGSSYNVRMIVVGDRRPVPVETPAPESLDVLTTYEQVWGWSNDVLAEYPQRAIAPAVDEVQPAGEEVMPLVDAELAVEVPHAAPAAALAPWQLRRAEWERVTAEAREIAGEANNAALEALYFGVKDWARASLAAGQQEGQALSETDRAEIEQRLNLPVTHRDVIDKALMEGRPVPPHVRADYADLAPSKGRAVNEFQAPYQSASRIKAGETDAMIPLNMAGATYAALNDLQARHGNVDEYVASRLKLSIEDIEKYELFSADQMDALALAIQAAEDGRGCTNADMTGRGKGRFVAGMLRYAKLNGLVPVFLTIKPELFTDIFRDIRDIQSEDLFQRVFIMNDGETIKRFGTEDEVMFPATSALERRTAMAEGRVGSDVDLVVSTYSQFQRALEKNPKAKLLNDIVVSQPAMLVLDESHLAAGASNVAEAVGQAVANAQTVMYSSATPLKGAANYAIYHKLFPASVDLKQLPVTLAAGGDGLLEAVSTNLARDGVLIRREHDYSRLTFATHLPSEAVKARNVAAADALADILSDMAFMAGDVEKMVSSKNKAYAKEWEAIPEKERKGQRMQATSMNFGSRLYNLNRQFLLAVKIEDAVETALTDLSEGRKPVIAVENTGESLLYQVLARRAGVESLERELDELVQRGDLTPEELERKESLRGAIDAAMRQVSLDKPPQYRELLEIYLERLGQIKTQGRYGDVSFEQPESEEYAIAVKCVRDKIKAFPDLPLTPIDVVRAALERSGHPTTEISGRTASLSAPAVSEEGWRVNYHKKQDAVAAVAGFQNGRFDAIVITRAGSTGISLHATDRFDDSDARQRDFIVLQKASNIAEFLQWMGRVDRRGQVVAPVITSIESGLPAEWRVTMMHNAKLRKLSANVTSNRENANSEGENLDLLNEVGDEIALAWLYENPDLASRLSIDLPDADNPPDPQEAKFINKVLGRLPLLSVVDQEAHFATLAGRFSDKVAELEERGLNPFKVDVYDWKAKVVSAEALVDGNFKKSGSSFDEPVLLTKLEYERTVFPLRSEGIKQRLSEAMEKFRAMPQVGEHGLLQDYREMLQVGREGAIRASLPSDIRDTDATLDQLMSGDKLGGAKLTQERVDWLIKNITAFHPGSPVTYKHPLLGEMQGIVVTVKFPDDKDRYTLSQYEIKAAFPGEEQLRPLTMATIRHQDSQLISTSGLTFDPAKFDRLQWFDKQAVKKVYDDFDIRPEGKVIESMNVLRGNIFRACELAAQERLGSTAVFTDENGVRQRAVVVKRTISSADVKKLPVAFDPDDLVKYVHEALRDARTKGINPTYAPHPLVRIFNSAVKDMDVGEGVRIASMGYGDRFRLSMPGAKNKAGALLTDGRLFDVGERTPKGSLRLRLVGNRTAMSCDFGTELLGEVLARMVSGKHVGKFYVPDPNIEILERLHAQQEAKARKKKPKQEIQEELALTP